MVYLDKVDVATEEDHHVIHIVLDIELKSTRSKDLDADTESVTYRRPYRRKE